MHVVVSVRTIMRKERGEGTVNTRRECSGAAYRVRSSLGQEQGMIVDRALYVPFPPSTVRS